MSLSVFSSHHKYPSRKPTPHNNHKKKGISNRISTFLDSSMDKKLRSANCFSSCFGGGSPASDESDERPISLIRSSSTWLKERAQDLPEFGERCRGLVDRIRWRRRPAGDFRYDPLSYARNFDDGVDLDEFDDVAQGERFRYRNFASRLPVEPVVVIA